MAEDFVADCITRMDHLCTLWFRDNASTQQYRIVHPVATFVKPRGMNYVAIVGMLLIAITVTAVIMQLTRQVETRE